MELFGLGAEGVADLTRDQLRIDPLQRHRQGPGLQTGQIQHLVDQSQQARSGGQDVIDRLALAEGQGFGRGVDAHQLREADDGVQRGAQFVAHGREEVGLDAVRGRQGGGLFVGGL